MPTLLDICYGWNGRRSYYNDNFAKTSLKLSPLFPRKEVNLYTHLHLAYTTHVINTLNRNSHLFLLQGIKKTINISKIIVFLSFGQRFGFYLKNRLSIK